MAGPHRWSLLPVAALLLLLAGLTAAEDKPEGDIKIQVRYPTEEESRWLDHWAAKAKYSPVPGSGSGDFEVHPATDEESAYLNSMVANADKRVAEGSSAAGFDGHLVFDENDRPQLVVDAMYSGGKSKTKMDDDLGNKEERSHVEDL